MTDFQNSFTGPRCITTIAENVSSTVSRTLHKIEVPEPVTVKAVVEELNKLNKRIKQYICFCLL